jgi:hypothetical protein
MKCRLTVRTPGVRSFLQKREARSAIRAGIACGVFLLLFMGISPSMLAQTTIRGVVVDSVTREPLIGANVYVPGTSLGSATNREGEFRIIGVPAGSVRLRFSYVGYTGKQMTVTAVEGGTVEVTVGLAADVVEGEEVVITAQARGQVAAINQQLTSNSIVNVISEEKIKELPDANAAEAIGRLPGV